MRNVTWEGIYNLENFSIRISQQTNKQTLNQKFVPTYLPCLSDHLQPYNANVKNEWRYIPTTSGVPRGGLGGYNPPLPEIPKISVESSIAWARRTGVSIYFCSSLCSYTVVIY